MSTSHVEGHTSAPPLVQEVSDGIFVYIQPDGSWFLNNTGFVAGREGVVLCKGGITKRFQVHRLVLEAWVAPCPKGIEGRHNDGSHLNNRLDNLRWDTRLSNVADKYKHNTQPLGETSVKAKLTENEVRVIRRREYPQDLLAKKYGVSQGTISHIQSRKTWKHVE